MRQTPQGLVLFLMIAIGSGFSGCATVRTMPTLASQGSPKLYSGARLDLNAARGDASGYDKFKLEAPAHPLMDFPFSVLLDTLILPEVLPVAAYEFIFEK
jgi:uncharacterized protein YceK